MNNTTQEQSPQLHIDPEFRNLIPPLAPDELRLLETLILADGCRDPIVIWDSVIVDGHNRYDICTRHNKPYYTITAEFTDRTAAMLWILDNQQGRRNLSDIDRIALATKRQALLKPDAEQSYRENVGRPRKSSAKLPTISKVDTRAEAAKSAGVGSRTYDAGKLILDAVTSGEADADVLERLRSRETSIHAEAKKVKETKQKAARHTKRVEAAKNAPPLDSRIIVGDFREQAARIADGSLSLIFTDPPYDRKSSEMLPDLAAFAAAKLAEGGSLICYVGQTQLPAALDALREHLRYWWIIACIHAGGKTVMREYGINAGWKALLWFVKTTRDDNTVMVNDVVSGGEEKDYHDWQQAQSEAEYWIEKLCPPDGLLCDPFLGGGTTAAAAERLNREWIGIEIDPEQAKIASARVFK